MFNDRSDHGAFFSNTGDAVYSEKDSDFRKIYNAVMQTLFRISYRIVNDEEAAEDLVHDSLIKMREKKLVFPSFSYCARITRQLYFDRRKGTKTRTAIGGSKFR